MATGDTDTRRAALVEVCLTASGTVRALGHVESAVATARCYDAAQLLGDPGLTAFAAMQRAGA